MTTPVRTGPRFEWPLMLVLAIVAAGVFVALDGWKRGSFLIGCGIGFGGWLRLVLSDDQAGLLRVRRKLFDVAMLWAIGSAIVILAFIVPPLRR